MREDLGIEVRRGKGQKKKKRFGGEFLGRLQCSHSLTSKGIGKIDIIKEIKLPNKSISQS